MLKLGLQVALVVGELLPQLLNSLMHDFLPLFVLAHVLIDPLVHGSLRLREPEKHVRVIFHLHYETRRGIRENMERHLLIKYKVVFSIGQ